MIEVVLRDPKSGLGITDAEIACVRVASVGDDDGNFSFYHILNGTLVEEIDNAATAEVFYKEISNNPKEFKSYSLYKSNEDGIYVAENLPTGLYLIIQKKAATNYDDMKPFLVSVPFLNEGEYKYQVTANVKTELDNEIDVLPDSISKPGKLPQTGQLLWPIPLLIAAGLLLIAVGCYLRRNKVNEEL
jgi:hypothetical protein